MRILFDLGTHQTRLLKHNGSSFGHSAIPVLPRRPAPKFSALKDPSMIESANLQHLSPAEGSIRPASPVELAAVVSVYNKATSAKVIRILSLEVAKSK